MPVRPLVAQAKQDSKQEDMNCPETCAPSEELGCLPIKISNISTGEQKTLEFVDKETDV